MSFRSDSGPFEPYIPKVLDSPARPKPPKNTNCGDSAIDTGSTCEDNQEVDRTPSTAPAVHDMEASGSVYSTTSKDAKQENEGTETKERGPLPSSDQDGERMGLGMKGDSSPIINNQNKMDLNINHSERANTKVLAFDEYLKEPNTHPEELNEPGSEIENGKARNCKANMEGPEVSCKVNT